jgi:hypothetical protein
MAKTSHLYHQTRTLAASAVITWSGAIRSPRATEDSVQRAHGTFASRSPGYSTALKGRNNLRSARPAEQDEVIQLVEKIQNDCAKARNGRRVEGGARRARGGVRAVQRLVRHGVGGAAFGRPERSSAVPAGLLPTRVGVCRSSASASTATATDKDHYCLGVRGRGERASSGGRDSDDVAGGRRASGSRSTSVTLRELVRFEHRMG